MTVELSSRDFKAQLKLAFPREKWEEKNLDIFVAHFLEGVQSNFSPRLTEDKARAINQAKINSGLCTETSPDIGILSYGQFHGLISALKHSAYIEKHNEAKKMAKFRGLLSKVHSSAQDLLKSDRECSGMNKIITDFLEEILDISERGLDDIRDNYQWPSKQKKGRKRAYLKSDLVHQVFVMAHCLLDIKASITSSDTKFNKLLDQCFEVANEVECDKAYYIKPCFEDYGVVIDMAAAYRYYNRLDLYVDHVNETAFSKDILSNFDGDWDEWEKPKNLKTL